MRIENALNELRGPDGSDQRSQEARRRRMATRSGDVVEISTAARSRGSQGVSRADLNAVADMRQDRIEAARQRASEGYYDRPEVRRAIADAVLNSGAVEDVRREAGQVREARGKMAEVPEVRDEAVTRARRRIASGFYETSAVRNQVANGIVDRLIG